MRFDILTIFPDLFKSFSQEALIARAQAKNIISINTHFLRDSGEGPHRKVDDRPYGGGAGMVLMPGPIASELAKIKIKKSKCKIVVFSAKGKKFNQAMARKYAKLDQLIMICGRYEGIDERVAQYLADEEISIGDYVLFGGEVPAMVVMEAVTRLLPESLGNPGSLHEESFSKHIQKEYPWYTRPEVWQGHRVPPVLLSGNHKKIEEWRRKKTRIKAS
ncbi:MAG: tRNA (guanosine(37)-N1)-methyltransferase TrmD [Patescibacteria group bacterium]